MEAPTPFDQGCFGGGAGRGSAPLVLKKLFVVGAQGGFSQVALPRLSKRFARGALA